MVFLRIQRKSIKEDACKGLRSNGATRCLQIFGENLRRMAFTNSFYFVTDRSLTADGGLLSPTGCVQTTPQKTRFRSVNKYKELQEIHIQVKSEYVGTVTTTRMRRTTSTTTCLTWTQT